MAEINYAGGAIDFWAKHAEKFLADEKIRATHARRHRQEARRRATSRSA